MKSLQDAIYNWLTIKVVCDHRPDDTAAVDTEKMFYEIMIEQFNISNIEVSIEDDLYYVEYEQNGIRDKKRFPKELIEVMLEQINLEPEKYKNFSDK